MKQIENVSPELMRRVRELDRKTLAWLKRARHLRAKYGQSAAYYLAFRLALEGLEPANDGEVE